MAVTDPIEKTICSALMENPKLGYNALKDIVFEVHEHCSNVTFARKLKRLQENQIVSRQDAPRGLPVYYSLTERFKQEKEAAEDFAKYVDVLEKSFKQVIKEYDRLETIEKANSLSILFGMTLLIRFQIDLLNIAEPNSAAFREQQLRVFDISRRIFDFSKEKSSPDGTELQLVYAMLVNEVLKMSELLENSLKNRKRGKRRHANSSVPIR